MRTKQIIVRTPLWTKITAKICAAIWIGEQLTAEDKIGLNNIFVTKFREFN